MIGDDNLAARAALKPPSARSVKIAPRTRTPEELRAERRAKRILANQDKRALDGVYRKAIAWAKARQQLGNEKSQAAKLGISVHRLRRLICHAKHWGEL